MESAVITVCQFRLFILFKYLEFLKSIFIKILKKKMTTTLSTGITVYCDASFLLSN